MEVGPFLGDQSRSVCSMAVASLIPFPLDSCRVAHREEFFDTAVFDQ
jgi:hypothetical protein